MDGSEEEKPLLGEKLKEYDAASGNFAAEEVSTAAPGAERQWHTNAQTRTNAANAQAREKGMEARACARLRCLFGLRGGAALARCALRQWFVLRRFVAI